MSTPFLRSPWSTRDRRFDDRVSPDVFYGWDDITFTTVKEDDVGTNSDKLESNVFYYPACGYYFGPRDCSSSIIIYFVSRLLEVGERRRQTFLSGAGEMARQLPDP